MEYKISVMIRGHGTLHVEANSEAEAKKKACDSNTTGIGNLEIEEILECYDAEIISSGDTE